MINQAASSRPNPLFHHALPEVCASLDDLSNRLMIDIEATSLTAEDCRIIAYKQVGGVILFTRNYQNPEQLRRLCADIHELRPDVKIAVDHEGGRVQRFRNGFSEIPAMRSLGALFRQNAPTAIAATNHFAQLMANELAQCGVDFTFAPVLDLDYQHSEVIGNRAFSSDPEILVELTTAFCAGLHSANMPAIGKHFPGHGFVTADSHTDLPVDTRELSELVAADLKPFAKHATIKLDAVMSAHVIYSKVDSAPAGYSQKWIKYLKQNLGFSGMIFSDDLSMAGALGVGGISARCQSAITAGSDVLLICNNRADVKTVLENGW